MVAHISNIQHISLDGYTSWTIELTITTSSTTYGILQLTCLIKYINAVNMASYINVSIVMNGYT